VHVHEIYVVYANAASKLGGSRFRFSLFESICFFFKTSLLACNHFQIWRGVDNSILWLSFAQQKCMVEVKSNMMRIFPI
jgi:hypothetical protein